jgi:hypothetical protein
MPSVPGIQISSRLALARGARLVGVRGEDGDVAFVLEDFLDGAADIRFVVDDEYASGAHGTACGENATRKNSAFRRFAKKLSWRR